MHWLSILVLSTIGSDCIRTDHAPGVNPAAIKSIELGMNLETVIDKLGIPYSMGALHSIHSNGSTTVPSRWEQDVTVASQIRPWLDKVFTTAPCCAGNAGDRVNNHFVLVYSRMVEEYGVSPMLWVHFENDRVCEVFAKINSRNSDCIDDIGVYLLNRNHPSVQLADDQEQLLKKYFSQ